MRLTIFAIILQSELSCNDTKILIPDVRKKNYYSVTFLFFKFEPHGRITDE